MLNSKVQDFIHLTNDLLPKQKLFWIRFIREKTTNICMSILSISSMYSSEKKTIKFSKRKTHSNVTGKIQKEPKQIRLQLFPVGWFFKKSFLKSTISYGQPPCYIEWNGSVKCTKDCVLEKRWSARWASDFEELVQSQINIEDLAYTKCSISFQIEL